jgi:hypothetical protein
MASADQLEIILNLWYVYDDPGGIYSLRARAYLASGSDEERLEMLRRLAPLDYLIAQPFPVPERFHTTILEGGEETRMAVAVCALLNQGLYGPPLALFEDAVQQIEKQLPAQTRLSVGTCPLVCITPLYADANEELHPKTEKWTYLRAKGA